MIWSVFQSLCGTPNVTQLTTDNWCRKKETFRVPNELSTASVSDNATATAALNVACGSQLRAHFTDYRKLLKDIGQVEV